MKNKLFDFFIVIISLISLGEIIFNNNIVFSAIAYSLRLWVNSIIPSLFPMFIISEILISYNINNYIPRFIKKLFKRLFNVDDNVIAIFFLSMLAGFPSSSRMTRYMYDNRLIDKKMASYVLVFTHFSNPLFILSTVSIFFLHNRLLGIIILISHYLPNIILGIVMRNGINSNCQKINNTINNISFSKVFIRSIRNAIDTLLMVLGTITCFLVMASIVSNIFNFNIYVDATIKGLFEMTIGLKSISMLAVSDLYKTVMSSMIISFGGLSVHMQILSFIADTDISYKPFLVARIYHSLMSGVFVYVLYNIFI